jgi:hypothetical protein
MNAGTSEEGAVPASGGATVVKGSAIIGEDVTVDVVVQGFASAAKSNSSIRRRSEPTKKVGRCIPVSNTGCVVHAGESSNVVLRNRQTASTQPETTAQARAKSRWIRCVGVIGTSAVGLGDDTTRDTRGRCTLGVESSSAKSF